MKTKTAKKHFRAREDKKNAAAPSTDKAAPKTKAAPATAAPPPPPPPQRRKRGRKAVPDKAVAAALEEAGGVVGRAAAALGVRSRTVRRKVGTNAADPEMRGLPEKIRARVRLLVRRNVLAALEAGDGRMTLEIMRSRICDDLGFSPAAASVHLSGKVDGDVRVGPLDREEVAARLAALGVAGAGAPTGPGH